MDCPTCNGAGQYLVDVYTSTTGHMERLQSCSRCEGTGEVPDEEPETEEEDEMDPYLKPRGEYQPRKRKRNALEAFDLWVFYGAVGVLLFGHLYLFTVYGV